MSKEIILFRLFDLLTENRPTKELIANRQTLPKAALENKSHSKTVH